LPYSRVRRWLSLRRLIRLDSARGSKKKRSQTLKYGSPELPHQSVDPASAPTFGVSAYEDWSPAAAWRAAEERWRASERRGLAQFVREPKPTGRSLSVPRAVPRRALGYAACALGLAVVGHFAVRAFHSRDHAWLSRPDRVVAQARPSTNRPHVQPATRPAVVPKTGANVEPKTFAWVPVPGARAYDVEFEQGGRVIYSSRTRQPRLRLGATWTYHARRYAFYPGVYHWHVWPIFPTAQGSHRGPASVVSTMTIPS
jgi:hypothetical protein